jgi:hypothetical protein
MACFSSRSETTCYRAYDWPTSTQRQYVENWGQLSMVPPNSPWGNYEQSVCKQEPPQHVCSKKCKEEEKDFYEGIVTYHKLSHPELVKKEEELCNDSKCLVERINNKLKK